MVGAIVLLISSTAAADYAAGLAAFNRKDFAHAFSEWIESAKAGDAHAQHGIGMLYELGQGVPYADPKAAAEWYQKAAAQNYAPALNNLARLYADGRGVKQDVPKAIGLWSRAAEAGNVTARFNLGLQYAAGSGVQKDMKKAAEYLLQAAESGLPEAQFAVAGFYRDGTGVEKDLDAARQWYDRAAAAGFEPARAELAALDRPAVGSAPAVEDGTAAPADNQQAQAQKTETPPQQPAGTEAKTEEKPAEAQPQEAAPTETQQAAPPPPAEEPKQPEQPAPAEAPAEEASPAQPPAEEPGAPAEAEPAQEAAPANPVGGGDAAMNAPGSDLPVATSLTGDAQVYRIWIYESGQEGDARSYWDKLTMQYPGLLKKLDVDIRRYFLGDAKGSLYRVFAGPFDNLGAAQKACEDIKARFGDHFCRPVLN
ncbi:MAG TPA: SPOR domain-containing protein [Dongiaceae bacterium]|nr:SPOR domain-containing protein [Dongiaceae bacterium]